MLRLTNSPIKRGTHTHTQTESECAIRVPYLFFASAFNRQNIVKTHYFMLLLVAKRSTIFC